MFIVGLEVNLKELAKVGVLAGIAGTAGAIAPIVLGVPLVMAFHYHWQAALFAGVTLAATSVSISAQVLLELGYLRTKVGNALLATALIDDVLAILLVSLAVAVTGVENGGTADLDIGSLVLIVVRMAIYIGGAFVVSWFGLPRLMKWLDRYPAIKQSYGFAAIALLVALLFGWTAESWGGVAAITGAFIAGIGFSRAKEDIQHEVETAISNHGLCVSGADLFHQRGSANRSADVSAVGAAVRRTAAAGGADLEGRWLWAGCAAGRIHRARVAATGSVHDLTRRSGADYCFAGAVGGRVPAD